MLRIEQESRHPSVAKNFDVAPRFLETFCTSDLKEICVTLLATVIVFFLISELHVLEG